PMACIRAEWAWLHADPAAVDEATRDTYAIALDRGTPWDVGPLALWRRRGGVLDRVPDGLPEPYALELAGRAAAAADAWQRLGEPHSRALALLGSDRPEDVLQAIEILDRTGALAAVPLARGRLRALGVASVPRGRARTTRGNPAGLTDRQLDVLRLVGQGLTNREIAGRLVLSSKTVEHHVGAVFAKLGVTSRAEAAAARVLGLEGPA
ncbi:MAG TPA: LuxR C-terminal-related transcriptional regulator, partial [Micropruina sp.]|nr:LuxR C-terminal-related transcriptional regulator [Micropruina sp.]